MSFTLYKELQTFTVQKKEDVFLEPEALRHTFFEFLSSQRSFILHSKDLQKSLEFIKTIVTCRQAAGGLVVNSKGQLLTIERFKKLDLPKGHIDAGESKQTAALREIEEECGIVPDTIIDELPPSYHLFKEKEQWILKEVFWFYMIYKDSKIPVPQYDEHITAAAWKTKEQVKAAYNLAFASLRVNLNFFLTMD